MSRREVARTVAIVAATTIDAPGDTVSALELPDDFQLAPLADVDPEIAEVLARELERQQGTLEMIASENFVPQAVLEAAGSVLDEQVRRGVPRPALLRRLRGGRRRRAARDRPRQELFGAEHVNVQPHAGAQANNAAYMALLEPGDTIMGMALDHGGHLTHGMKLNVSGKLYEVVAYHVRREDHLVRHGRGRAARARAPAQGDRRRAGRPTRASSTSPPSARSPTPSARA